MGRAVTRYLGGRRFETAVGRFEITTDHAGTGPTPTDLFIASLPGCVAFYVAEYCERIGLDASGLTVELDYARGPRNVSGFSIVVRLPNVEVGARTEALRRVAEACYVHETIRTFGGCPVVIRDASAVAA